jgi:hypothetical protein
MVGCFGKYIKKGGMKMAAGHWLLATGNKIYIEKLNLF